MTLLGRLMAAVLLGLRVAVGAIAGLVLMLSALVFGVALGAAVLLWQRLAGRRARTTPFGWRVPRKASRPGTARGDVIDVEAREVAIERRPVR